MSKNKNQVGEATRNAKREDGGEGNLKMGLNRRVSFRSMEQRILDSRWRQCCKEDAKKGRSQALRGLMFFALFLLLKSPHF